MPGHSGDPCPGASPDTTGAITNRGRPASAAIRAPGPRGRAIAGMHAQAPATRSRRRIRRRWRGERAGTPRNGTIGPCGDGRSGPSLAPGRMPPRRAARSATISAKAVTRSCRPTGPAGIGPAGIIAAPRRERPSKGRARDAGCSGSPSARDPPRRNAEAALPSSCTRPARRSVAPDRPVGRHDRAVVNRAASEGRALASTPAASIARARIGRDGRRHPLGRARDPRVELSRQTASAASRGAAHATPVPGHR